MTVAVSRRSLETQTGPEAHQIEALELVSRLIAVEEKARPPRHIKTWHAIAVALVILAFLTLLLSERKHVEIELEATTTYVKFLISTDLDPKLTIPAQRVSLSGFKLSYVPGPNDEKSYRPVSSGRLTLLAGANSQLQFDAPHLTEASTVELKALAPSRRYRIGFCSPSVLMGKVFGRGSIEIANSSAWQATFGDQSSIEFWSMERGGNKGFSKPMHFNASFWRNRRGSAATEGTYD